MVPTVEEEYLVYYVLEGAVCEQCVTDEERARSDTSNTRTRKPGDKKTATCNRCKKQI